jgi:hypothetical protein
MSENTPLNIHVNQSHVRNAVRDIVAGLLTPEALKQSLEAHVNKEKQRISDHTDALLKTVVLSRETLDKYIDRKLTRELEQQITNAVMRKTEEIIRDTVEIAVEHIVKNGTQVKLGYKWGQQVTLKTSMDS